MSIIRRMIASPLLVINFVFYFVIAAIAGWALNLAIDVGWEAVSYNPATFYLVMFALIASVVGLASTLSAVHHTCTWHASSLSGASASGVIAWLLSLLALGVVGKEISLPESNYLCWQLKALEALIILVVITQLLYLLTLGAVSRRECAFGRREHQNREVEAPAVAKE